MPGPYRVVWVGFVMDVGRPDPRPPGRLAAMRSLTDRRCRGRRPRRPAEVSGGGRYTGGMNPSPTGFLLAGVGRKAAEGSRPLPTGQKTNGVVMARLCERVADERGEGGRQPSPSQWAEVARELVATHSPSESPSHLTVTAPFDKGAFLPPAGVRGNSRVLKRSGTHGR